MVVVFYNPDNDSLYICSPESKTKIMKLEDPSLLHNIPEDMLWVSDAAYITKSQFIQWIKGEISFAGSSNVQPIPNRFQGFLSNERTQKHDNNANQFANSMQKINNRQYIHPKHHGTIVISTVKTKKFPDGLELKGKYHFEPLDELPPNIENNPIFMNLLKKGKIEIVNHDYVMKNAHKSKNMTESDSILIKSGSAKDIAHAGGIDNYDQEEGNDNGPIEIMIS